MTVSNNSGVAAARKGLEELFSRDTVDVARALLGRALVRRLPDGRVRRLVLVETEAYLGVGDRAAHTWNGRKTARVLPMWGPAGHAYVYRVYGLHDCLNLVTREAGVAEAVLLRAAGPEAWWRGEACSRAELLDASGPGRLCRTLGVTRELSGTPLGPEAALDVTAPVGGRPFEVLSGPRVGVAYAAEAAAWPLRFAVAGCPAVTRPRGLSPAPARPRRPGPGPSSSRGRAPGRPDR